jgi:hypothetical protein
LIEPHPSLARTQKRRCQKIQRLHVKSGVPKLGKNNRLSRIPARIDAPGAVARNALARNTIVGGTRRGSSRLRRLESGKMSVNFAARAEVEVDHHSGIAGALDRQASASATAKRAERTGQRHGSGRQRQLFTNPTALIACDNDVGDVPTNGIGRKVAAQHLRDWILSGQRSSTA